MPAQPCRVFVGRRNRPWKAATHTSVRAASQAQPSLPSVQRRLQHLAPWLVPAHSWGLSTPHPHPHQSHLGCVDLGPSWSGLYAWPLAMPALRLCVGGRMDLSAGRSGRSSAPGPQTACTHLSSPGACRGHPTQLPGASCGRGGSLPQLPPGPVCRRPNVLYSCLYCLWMHLAMKCLFSTQTTSVLYS